MKQKIRIKLTGVAAELTLGNYMPVDPTIIHNWEEFYRYNDLIHHSQLLADYVNEVEITVDEKVIYSGKIPTEAFKAEKSYTPVMEEGSLYLRTECAENGVFEAAFEAENFNIHKLRVHTQDYDQLFKVGKSFVTAMSYLDQKIELEWTKADPVGNICLLCRFEKGYLIPVYDAIRKIEHK